MCYNICMIKERTEFYDLTDDGDVMPPYNDEMPAMSSAPAEIDPLAEEARMRGDIADERFGAELRGLRARLESYGATQEEIDKKVAQATMHEIARRASERTVDIMMDVLTRETARVADAWTPSGNHPEPSRPRERDWMERAAGDY